MRKSIIIRDKLYKEIIEEKNELTKNRKYKNLRKYRNQLINQEAATKGSL